MTTAKTSAQTQPSTLVVNTGSGTDWITVVLLGALAVGGYLVIKKYLPSPNNPPPDVDEGDIAPADAALATKAVQINVSDPYATITVNLAFIIERQGRPFLGQGWYAEVELLDETGRRWEVIIPSLVGWGFENDPTQQVNRSVPIGALPVGTHTITAKIRAREYPQIFGQATGQYAVRNLSMSAISQGGGGVGPGTGYKITLDQVSVLQGQLILQNDRLYTAGEIATVSGLGTGYGLAQWKVQEWRINGTAYRVDINTPSQTYTAPDGSPVYIQNSANPLTNKSMISFRVSGPTIIGTSYTLF
ncbi:hypothetical protein ABFB09_07995 [Dehalogenimonas sp. THU2]|uniref:hypothetical protein n=1 Tax=Dehalogenimonas sp. THU2 TaxID=3151121 RepID=UPI003218AB96